MMKIVQKSAAFLRKEAVLCIAAVLAVTSSFFVPPSATYLSYIDWDTLALLFGLMAVMKGFQREGMFVFLGNLLLKRTVSSRQMILVLVFLPFVCSMVITNDVSLLTFVPFGMIVLRLAHQERLAVPLVVLQTVAANLGSMFTPMGNPQNLYLYAQSGMGFGWFCLLMAPFVLLSGVCLGGMILLRKSEPVPPVAVETRLGSRKKLACCTAGFILCLLGLFQVIPPVSVAVVIAVFLLIADRKVLAGVDYPLLGTFVAFFIFVGNLGSLEAFKSFLASILAEHTGLTAVLASQIISNVPAALLLSGFTANWKGLIVGCNLGGLGTLIASMASLISYKLMVREYPEQRKRYLLWFTVCNVSLLAVLLLAGWGLGHVIDFWSGLF